MRQSKMKGDRDLVSIERSLGLKSVRGISRQANKDAPPIRSLLEGIRIIAQAYVTRSNGEIRSSQVLKDDAHDLLEQYGPEIWPGPDQDRPAWLEEPSTTEFGGKYPQHRYYTDPADREFLNNTFYQLVVEKCCNYHDNQLQKHRRSSAKHTGGQDHSASGTPRQGDYADEAESETEFVTAHAPPSWPAVNDPVTRRLPPPAPPPALSPPANHSPEFRPHGLPGFYLFGSNEEPAADATSGAVNEMPPIPDRRRPSQLTEPHVYEDQAPTQDDSRDRDRDGDEVLLDAPVNGHEPNGDYLNGYKRKRTGSIESEVASKRSRVGSIDERSSLIVTLKADPNELLRISKRTRESLYNNNFLGYYTRDSSPEETSSRRSVRSLRSERQSTIHSTPGPDPKAKPMIQVKQYKDRRNKWYEVDTDERPHWAVDERIATRAAPEKTERRRSAWVKRHGPISPSSVNAASELSSKARSDDAIRQPTENGTSVEKASNHDEDRPDGQPETNGRRQFEATREEQESSGKNGLLSPSKSPGPQPPKGQDPQDNARALLNAFADPAQTIQTIQTAKNEPDTEHERRPIAPPPPHTVPLPPFAPTAPEVLHKTSASPMESVLGFRPSETLAHTPPEQRVGAPEPPRFAVPDRVSRPTSSSDAGPQQLQHVFKARSSEQPVGVKNRITSVSEYVPPLSIVRARNPEEEERAQARLGAFRPSVGDGQFIQFALPQHGKEAAHRQEDERPHIAPPAHKPEQQQLKASATPEMAASEAVPTAIPQPQQPKRSIQPAAGAPAAPAPPSFATPKALVEDTLGSLAVYPTVQHMLATFPTLSKVELENLRLIVSNDLAARNDWRALQRYLRAEIMYGALESVDFRILQQYVYNNSGGPPPPELQTLFSKQGGPKMSLPSNAASTPRQQQAVPAELKSAAAMKPEIVRPLTIQSVAPVMPAPAAASVPTPMAPPAAPAKSSEPPDNKSVVTGSEDESLNNTYIEINWGHEAVDFNDYMEMRDFKDCGTATEFFGRIEAKIPDEVAKEGRPIREIRLKATTELKAASRMPRFLRDDSAVRAGWRQLVKILRSQPLGTEAELEFLVIWGEKGV